MPLTGLAPLDSSWQPARFFVINDRRLQANRVDHRSFAGFSLHNLGSGQQVAAGARRRGRRSAHRSAVKFSCSGGATMWKRLSPIVSKWMRASRARAAPGRAVDEEQPLVRPEDSAKCLVQQLWPALLASLEAQARGHYSQHALAACACTYTACTELVHMQHTLHTSRRCTCHMLGERRHPLQRFATDRESKQVGAADCGAPR